MGKLYVYADEVTLLYNECAMSKDALIQWIDKFQK